MMLCGCKLSFLQSQGSLFPARSFPKELRSATWNFAPKLSNDNVNQIAGPWSLVGQ